MTSNGRDESAQARRAGPGDATWPARAGNAIAANPSAAEPRGAAATDAGWSAGLALIARSVSRSWKPLAAVCVILIGLQVVLVLNASAQMQAQTFSRMAEMMPAFLRRTLGDLTLVMLSFQGLVSVGFFHPVFVLLVSMLGVYFGSEPASDIEAGFVDLLLARPLRRHWLITRSLALILIGTCAPLLAMSLTMPVALRLFAPANAPGPAAVVVVKMALNVVAVASVFGALSLLVASMTRRRGTPIAVAGIVAMVSYLVMFLEPTWAPARTVGWLLPFHYFQPMEVLAGRIEPWRNLLVLGTLGLTLTAGAYWQFARRDL